MHHDTWTVEALTHLLVSNGMAPRLAKHGALFVSSDPLPQTGRPGEPAHPDTPCLLWAGGLDIVGYGQVRTQSGMRLVHSVAFTLTCGPVPDGMDLAHRCERRSCGRPDHVRPATRQANVREGANRRYPDWLLDRAPRIICQRCGAPMTAYVHLRASAWRPHWSMTCRPCSRITTPGVPRQRSQASVRMSDADVEALRAFLG